MENKNSDDPEFEYFKNLVLEHLGAKEPYNIGRFTDYDAWADDLFYKAGQFKKKKGVYPNIMLAKKSTYDKIDEACKKNPAGLHCTDGDDNGEKFDGGLSAFVTNDFEITFCLDVDNKLQDDEFKLIFDEKPTFDGEEIEEDYGGEIYYPKAA